MVKPIKAPAGMWHWPFPTEDGTDRFLNAAIATADDNTHPREWNAATVWALIGIANLLQKILNELISQRKN